ncbi:MAG: tetratricopeptide repeat protein [Kiritimatiellia bacterium]|jgi:tetratricopeptide (TPR) repeat protein
MTKEQTPSPSDKQVQLFFNKGFAAFERGSLDMAVDLLMQCVEMAPNFERARKFLHSAAIQRALKKGRSSLQLAGAELAGFGAFLRAQALKGSKPEAALLAAEKMILAAPLSKKYAIAYADIATAAGQPDIGVMGLEVLLEQWPGDPGLLSKLAVMYQTIGEWARSRDCYAELQRLFPRNPDYVKALKEAEARVTVKTGGWEENTALDGQGGKDDFRKLIRDKEQAKTLDMKNKSVIDGSDADVLIEEQKAKIARDPANLNFRIGLARLYSQKKDFASAVATLEEARERNPTDPELDRVLTNARIADYDARVAAAKDSGDAALARELERERGQFVFDDLVSRVERYPNDLRLRFELGQQYFQYEAYDDAIQQFQLAQKSPKDRNESLCYLARCFRSKGQKEMAVMQLETALAQLPIMNDLRKQVLFELGEIAEENGDIEKAFAYYQEIYGADISYRDIGEKMQRIYTLRQA